MLFFLVNGPLLPEGNRIELIVPAAQNLLVLKSGQFSVSRETAVVVALIDFEQTIW